MDDEEKAMVARLIHFFDDVVSEVKGVAAALKGGADLPVSAHIADDRQSVSLEGAAHAVLIQGDRDWKAIRAFLDDEDSGVVLFIDGDVVFRTPDEQQTIVEDAPMFVRMLADGLREAEGWR